MKDTNCQQEEEIRKNFDTAVRLVRSLPQKGSFQPSYAEAAKIYSYFKQSMFGKCNIPKPSFWDYINRAKWDAWTALGNMPQLDAMNYYVSEIKNIYIRVKDLPEFQEKEHEWADILIPFCQVNNIELSPKLLEVVKKSCNENGNHVKNVNSDESIKDHDEVENDFTIQQQEGLNSCDHSLMVENSLSEKIVSFQVNGDLNGDKDSGADKSDEEDEEDIYCDPIDPESIAENKDSTLFEITNLSESSSEIINNDTTSTPDAKHIKTATSSISTNSDSFEVLPNLNGETKKHVSSSLSIEFKRSLKKQERKTVNRKHQRINNNTHHGPRTHKRLEQQKENSNQSQGPNNRNQISHQSNVPFNQHHVSPNPSRRNNAGDSGSDRNEDDSFSTTSSIDSDTVGLRIVNALERMEENMYHVLDRLDSIDDSIKSITKPPLPWWKEYFPSKSIILWGVWPVLVNFLFFLYWKKITRQKLKKC